MNGPSLFRGLVLTIGLSALSASALATDIVFEHMDIDIDYSGGAGGTMTLDFRTYSPMSAGVPTNNDDYSPAGNPIIVPVSSTYVVPGSASWSCLGAPGSTVYRLTQTLTAGEVWLGLNTQDVPAATFVNNKVAFQLVSVVSAPAGARFTLYSTNSFGTPTFLLNSTAGACNIASYPSGGLTNNVHTHAFWAFSAPGTYVLRFKATGTLVAGLGGGTKTSGDVDVTFKVQ
ncbi:MAG TPA: choice-of-anchor M domain-containing protein [Polyangiaceae bacterium]|nr:choice-of-anchor M domain-containing protein [Polyangiaceae bacterium]